MDATFGKTQIYAHLYLMSLHFFQRPDFSTFHSLKTNAVINPVTVTGLAHEQYLNCKY